MNIIVCMKAIGDTKQAVFDTRKKEITNINWVANPPDMSALEVALQIKKEHGGHVTTLCVGDTEGEKVLRNTLIAGADKAIRVFESNFDGADTWSISSVIATVVKPRKADLVICGDKSRDTSSQMMGAALAEIMKVPLVTGACSLEVEGKYDVIVDKKLEKGQRETYRLRLPAVVAVDESICEPQYIPLHSKKYNQGMKKDIELVNNSMPKEKQSGTPLIKLNGITQVKPRTKIGNKMSGLSPMEKMKVLRGETGKKKEMFSGPADAAAEKILSKIKELGYMK